MTVAGPHLWHGGRCLKCGYGLRSAPMDCPYRACELPRCKSSAVPYGRFCDRHHRLSPPHAFVGPVTADDPAIEQLWRHRDALDALASWRTATTPRDWSVKATGSRPLTVNKVATMHRHAWAQHTKATRAEWYWLGKRAEVGPCTSVELTVTPLHADRRSPQDVAACAPEAKAAIDGLVDAGLIPDDSPQHLLSVTFLPPLVCGEDGLAIDIREVHP
jgi:crossover junction endodeoxyribonuclease RusA